MTKELLISSSPHETKVAVIEDDQLVEVYFQRDTDVGMVGGIYKGRVNRVLPGMQSAFVNIGLERDAFLYVSDFFEDSEEYDRVFTEAENRVARLGGEGDGKARISPPVAESGTEAAPSAEPDSESTSPGVTSPPPDAAAESQAPVQKSPESAPVTRPSESGDLRHREFPGRRNRRRGRFREGRFAGRHETPERREELQPSHQGLDLLPGESLAKYGHAAPETTALAPSETAPPESFEETSHFETSESAESAISSKALEGSDSAPSLANPTGNLVSSSETAGERLVSAESAFPELPEIESVELLEAAAGITQPEPEVHAEPGFPSSAAEPAAPQESMEPENFEGPDSAGEAQGEGRELAPSSPAAEGSVKTETPETSYTLRESHRSARIAPRRNRRGRGRFRSHHNQRPEPGGHSQQEAPRTGNQQPVQINQLLKEGQEILVQIAKEPLGTKGARITSHIALPGRYLVYMPTIDHTGVSRKIASEDERLRLRNIILENRGAMAGGFIVRTAGAGRSEDEIKADLAFLTNLWNDIRAKAERTKAPALLHRDLTLVERLLRDLLSPEFKTVRMDNEIEYEHVLDFVNRFQPALIGHVKLYTRDTPLFEEFGVQGEIDKALKPKVWLKSGGYIVINQTEALIAIDVNTGKFVGRTNRLEDTIVRTNIDAVKEIVRQIRLRDLGGIIVIDFIDMDERRNRNRVVQELEDALRHDRAPTKILSFNEFGLVALTRKRVKQSLERTLCDLCSYCSGAGWVKSVATVSNEIVSECRKMAAQIDGDVINLRVSPQVAAHLKGRDGVLISEIEAATRKEVVIKSDAAVHQEQFEIF